MTTIMLADEPLTLFPEAALYWAREQTLFVADIHFGKTDSIRRRSLPIPSGTTLADLNRLSLLIAQTGARRLVVLGDLLHAYGALTQSSLAAFSAWRSANPDLALLLIRGNHDRATGDPPKAWGFEVQNPGYVVPPFVLHHEPHFALPYRDRYALCGHLHPGARLVGKGRQAMTLPCFWVQPSLTVLPAFGSFTGVQAIEPHEGDAVYVIADSAIVPYTISPDNS